MFKLPVVFRLFHVDIQLIKSKNNYLLQQHKVVSGVIQKLYHNLLGNESGGTDLEIDLQAMEPT
jgi:DNA phosphorothioation-dependent restriction protein DptG